MKRYSGYIPTNYTYNQMNFVFHVVQFESKCYTITELYYLQNIEPVFVVLRTGWIWYTINFESLIYFLTSTKVGVRKRKRRTSICITKKKYK